MSNANTQSSSVSLVDLSLSKSLEMAVNTAIRLDEQQGALFDPLDGQTIALQIAPFSSPIYCIINQRQALFQNQLQGTADASVRTHFNQFIGLPLGDTLQADTVTGNPDVAKQFVDALNHMEIDWEEHLSHYTGDLVAFKLGHSVRSVLNAKQQTKTYMGETVKEYLLFEMESLPPRHQVDHFVKEVNRLNQQVDQIAERIAKLG